MLGAGGRGTAKKKTMLRGARTFILCSFSCLCVNSLVSIKSLHFEQVKTRSILPIGNKRGYTAPTSVVSNMMNFLKSFQSSDSIGSPTAEEEVDVSAPTWEELEALLRYAYF